MTRTEGYMAISYGYEDRDPHEVAAEHDRRARQRFGHDNFEAVKRKAVRDANGRIEWATVYVTTPPRSLDEVKPNTLAAIDVTGEERDDV